MISPQQKKELMEIRQRIDNLIDSHNEEHPYSNLISIVEEVYQVSIEAMLSRRKLRHIVEARWCLYYLIRLYFPKHSYPDIAEKLYEDSKQYSKIIFGVKSFERLLCYCTETNGRLAQAKHLISPINLNAASA